MVVQRQKKWLKGTWKSMLNKTTPSVGPQLLAATTTQEAEELTVDNTVTETNKY